MNALIFGINGQDGYYLQRFLLKNGIDVTGVSRTDGAWVKGNVADFSLVESLIKNLQPSYIFHLAANSTTRHDVLFENHQTIGTGALNILETCLRHSRQSKIFLAGSGLQFVNRGEPIHENDPFQACNPYCVFRIQSVYAARYFRTLGLQVYVGYLFNHDSPLRQERHLTQQVALATRRIANGSREKLEIGDLSVRKEYTFAGDVAEAIWAFVQNDKKYEVTIGSGKAYSIEDWLKECFGIFQINWSDHVLKRDHYKSEYQVLVSNPASLFSLGWRPKVELNDLAQMMILGKTDKV